MHNACCSFASCVSACKDALHGSSGFQGFQFDFYIASAGHDAPEHFAQAYLLPLDTAHSNGSKNIPITGRDNKPIGELMGALLLIS